MYGGRAPKGVELCKPIKLIYVCMYFKQRFYLSVTVLKSLKPGSYISLLEKKANQQYEKISLCII